VVRHPQPGNPPLALASYFTTSHNIPSISYFINSFCHAESTVCKNKRTIPKLVMCDGSVALIQSVVLFFFKETLQRYLDRCFCISSGNYVRPLVGLPFLYMSANHFIKMHDE